MFKKVLLVGCGGVGSRHLQALVRVHGVSGIVVVDSSADSLALGKERLAEIKESADIARVEWFTSLASVREDFDLCIISTSAEARVQLIKQVIEKISCSNFLVEKVVAQSVAEYQDLLSFAKQHTINVWINCQTRTYKVHQYIKSRLKGAGRIFFSRSAGNCGLATSGVHTADLFCFFSGADQLIPQGAHVDPVLHASKRGPSYYDLSGILMATTARADDMVLSFNRGYFAPDTTLVESMCGRFIVDEVGGIALESYESEGWRWKDIPLAAEDTLVSVFMTHLYQQILEQGRCDLPTLQEAYPAHEYILTALLPVFQRLIGPRLQCCPIT